LRGWPDELKSDASSLFTIPDADAGVFHVSESVGWHWDYRIQPEGNGFQVRENFSDGRVRITGRFFEFI
jgi:hypothetical protein